MIIIVTLNKDQLLQDDEDKVTEFVTAKHGFTLTARDALIGKLDLEFATINSVLEDDISLMQRDLQALIEDEKLIVLIADE